ncbi:hypothetical protein KIL84_010397 [Mauremys mutica]|uniref:Uncharacterized protein n=1 Tax=Mauremys mutica TaxID=74926 RepID=A0A9D3XCH5_9SAUR|nr:hypothetical protein KIL84_010397 [Mauremys mutica]
MHIVWAGGGEVIGQMEPLWDGTKKGLCVKKPFQLDHRFKQPFFPVTARFLLRFLPDQLRLRAESLCIPQGETKTMMRRLLLLLAFAVLAAATMARPTMQELLAVEDLGAVGPHGRTITQENGFQTQLKGGRVRRSEKGKKKGRWNPGSLTALGAAVPKGRRG